MDREAQIAAIKQARDQVIAVLAACDSPQLDAILRSADMELHWALWNLGEPVSLRAEMDYPAAVSAAG